MDILSPRKILIIGNSDGIGAAVTRALVARGDKIVGVSRSPSPLDMNGPRHETLDITSSTYPALLQRLLAEEGPFDVCIYCAAIGSGLTLPDLSREAHVIEVNLTSMVRTLSALTPGWMGRSSGHFIGLSSLADDFYNQDAPSYTASKAAFSNYLVSMAMKLRPYGVSVTNIRFGYVDTKLPKANHKPMMMTPERAADHVLRCMKTRPIQLSIPKTIGLILHGLRWIQSVRVWTA
ncbi:MAG: SDR family NAD(P)-dependent oxidoreductase [Nitrospirales bacterium]|nr:SDR family NAD(P)-dependent oxidoreductase [Nitrospira sp.]MDR4500001.1 SDR family NAD(P)-dependent oxidoreductase [Nitrospirales bacterium]